MRRKSCRYRRMAKKKDKEIKALTIDLERAKTAGNLEKQSDIRLQLANEHRRLGNREEALEELHSVLDLAGEARIKLDECLALRGIAEIYAEDGDERCREILDKFEARVRNDPTEHQLMLTVACYCLIKLYSIDEKKDHLLEPAREYAEKSLRLLEYERMNEKKMLEGDSVSIRRTNCHRMLAEIAAYQGNQVVGETHSKAAFESAKGRKESQFEIMRARMDFTWGDDGHKLRAARELCEFADASLKNKRVEAHIFLAQAFFEQREVEKGQNTLLEICEVLSGKKSSVPDDDHEKCLLLLIFAYRVSERLARLRRCMDLGTRPGQQRHNDKLGDLYEGAGFRKAALLHYQAALDLSSTRKERRRALVSCAETAADMKMYAKAAGYFERVMKEESQTGIDVSETEASLFEMRLLAGLFASDSDMCLAIQRLENDGNKFMTSVYTATAKYYERRGNREEAERYWNLENHFNKVHEDEKANNEDEDSEESADSLDDMDDTEIVVIMREKARKRAKNRALAKSGKKENQYGESKLIERAREGTLEDVKILIQQGADVNKADPAGWTPLSEAVGANNLEIVQYLLTKGADPNSQSKEGLMDTNFGGKITPLMEACLNGFCEIARWMLNHKDASKLVTTTNLDGWSPADFMAAYMKKARRGDESEAEFRQHMAFCKGVFESIRQLQRKCGFPIRVGDPPEVMPKSDDTPRFAEQKKDANRRARRVERRKGAAEDYQEAISSIGSRSRQADKENKKTKKKNFDDDDLFDTSDEEPLMRPSSSANSAAKKRALISSGSEDDDVQETMNKNRGRSSLDAEDANYGLEDVERPSPLQSQRLSAGSQAKRLSGVQMMLQKQKGGQKRSVEGNKKRSLEREDGNGIGIVPDEDVIEERVVPVEPKRRRHESESSRSEASAGLPQLQFDRRDSFSSTSREQWEQQPASATTSPVVMHPSPSPSRCSLSSASALAITFVKVIIERPGMEPDDPLLSKAPSDADIAQLPNHIPHVKSAIGGANCDWLFDGTAVVSTTLGDLAELCGKKIVEVRCRLRKTLRGELEKGADPADRDALPALSSLTSLESSRTPSLVLTNGTKYSEKTRDALWRVIDEYAREKAKENEKWRVESVQIENFNVPAFALRTLARMRPRDSLSLRHCEIDDEKLQEMTEELDSTARNGDVDCRLATLDLSYNDLIGSSGLLAKAIINIQGVHTLILQGLTGIEDGRELMKTLRGLSLLTLTLNENPWLDDGCMEELVKGEEAASEKMTSFKTLQLSKCAIKNLGWMEGVRALDSLTRLSVADNNSILPSGWSRVAGFVRSSSSLQSLDIRGTAVRAVILEALVARLADAPTLTLLCSRCNGITAAEICRVLSPLVNGETSATANLKLLLEKEKVEEVRATVPTLAARLLKVAPPNQ